MARGSSVLLQPLLQLRHRARELDLFSLNRASSRLAGNVKARFRGRGIDFDEVRYYHPGDDVRAIDWRVTARTGDAHIKLFREERERPVLVACDQRNSMQFGSRRCFKSVQAAELTALISWAALQHNDRVGGLVFSDRQHSEIRPARSKSAVLKLLRVLCDYSDAAVSQGQADTTGRNDWSIDAAIIELRRIARPGSAVFIISDFAGLSETGVKHLRLLQRHCDVRALFVYDPMERALPDRGGRYVTQGDAIVPVDLSDRQLRATFTAQFDTRVASLQEQLAQQSIPLLTISTLDDALAVLRESFYCSSPGGRPARQQDTVSGP